MRVVVVLWLMFSTGCGGGTMRKYAANALNCDRKKIDVRKTDDVTVIATGCGRSVTYKKQCGGEQTEYVISREGDSAVARPRTRSIGCGWVRVGGPW